MTGARTYQEAHARNAALAGLGVPAVSVHAERAARGLVRGLVGPGRLGEIDHRVLPIRTAR